MKKLLLSLASLLALSSTLVTAQVKLDAHSNSGGAKTWTITTTQPNEILLIGVGGCCGVLPSTPGTVTVNGNNAQYLSGTNSQANFPDQVWTYPAPTVGTYTLTCSEVGLATFFFNFSISVYEPGHTLTAANIILGDTNNNVGYDTISGSIVTTKPGTLVYCFSVFNDNGGTGGLTFNGSLTNLDHYYINNGVDGAQADSVYATAGYYHILVTDTNSTNPYGTIDLVGVEPNCFLLDSVVSQTNVSCNGNNNGSATVGASGGTSPYTYSWSPNGGTSATATGLTAGSYTVTITDNTGCSSTIGVTITQPSPLILTANANKDTICKGSPSLLTAAASGGTAPYTYNWSNGATTSTVSVSPTSSKTYSVTVQDSGGCASTTDSVRVIVLNCAGVKEVSQATDPITIYPNPTKGVFEVQFDGISGALTVEIYNALGEKIATSQLTATNRTIDMSSQPAGVYSMRVKTGNAIYTKRLVKID